MRAILAGGGTGGHVIPALAIANELKKSYAAEVLFIGTARGIENRLVPAAGYPLQLVRVGASEECEPDDAGEDGVRFAARGLGCGPDVERVRAGCGDWRGRICVGSGDAGGGGEAYSDAGVRAERGSGICESRGGAVCFWRGGAL